MFLRCVSRDRKTIQRFYCMHYNTLHPSPALVRSDFRSDRNVVHGTTELTTLHEGCEGGRRGFWTRQSRINCYCGGSSKDLGELPANKRHLVPECEQLSTLMHTSNTLFLHRRNAPYRNGNISDASHTKRSRFGHQTMPQCVCMSVSWTGRFSCNLMFL